MFRVAYHRRYNMGFPGAGRLHPFDLQKYARAWRQLKKTLGQSLQRIHLPVAAPVDDQDLLLVHSQEYLKALRTSVVVSKAIEVPSLRRAPWWLLDRFVLQPMRWATAGTILAGKSALDYGLAFNLGGGFHHAKPSAGEGFSIYNDIAVMARLLWHSGALAANHRIAYIDLDAHQGNGVACCFRDDPRVFMFDIHNGAIYPLLDLEATNRIDCSLPVRPQCDGSHYLNLLREQLPPFLDSISRSGTIGLAIYNAGTDILDGDPLGGLRVSMDDVLIRDRFVLRMLRSRHFPTVVLTSGGYTSVSYQAVARMVLAAVDDYGE